MFFTKRKSHDTIDDARRMPQPPAPQTNHTPEKTRIFQLKRLVDRAFTAYELRLLRAIVALAEFDGKELGLRLYYIATVSSLDGSWEQAAQALPPMIADLGDECPNATHHLTQALKHLKAVVHILQLIYPT
jgi:hypothetical protein